MIEDMCITEEKVKDIVHKELIPLEADFRSLKMWLLTIVSMFLVAIFGYGVWVGSISQKTSNTEQRQVLFETRIEKQLIRIEDKIDKLNDIK